jgi:hypothetical protein
MSNMSELDLRFREIGQRLTAVEQDNELLRKEVGVLRERLVHCMGGLIGIIETTGKRIDVLWEYVRAEE